ncbi:protein mono-ADP-ribosyltransferase TIPARP-like [Paramormyrops kingsleyae]|uniref:TCDD-inducible poly [ADP-ribose] polymerase-like n=1 Tax=Paramormyrops kingsleyae TaxID=1676925 RepID=A0A3B3RHC8_9TELE|nr:TCDD-inducible poly [ADP-ribose] polymerase-like [Paramormyrops kingsleyae]XP_023666693.1 TCDD-inducible poly [ADP-ribose] polymerase-like [Paramormyrops kingsleyae]XP_023666694.1 TCDD-inducible poly [ADP-ribose] polymerase-like [Paramormyrops kingsleyae]
MAGEVPLKKRKVETQCTNQEGLAKPMVITVFSTSQLVLQIPAQTNTSLPVWQLIHTGQVEVEWSEAPYNINIRITPLYPQAGSQTLSKTSATDQLVPVHQVPKLFTLPPVSAEPQTQSVVPPQFQTVAMLPAQTVTLFRSLDGSHLQPLRPPIPSVDRVDPASCLSQPLPRTEWVQQAYFHTRPRENIDICDNFLLGYCPRRSECPLHHTPYPFHWQIRRQDTHQWISTSHSAQLSLERLYSNKERESVKLREETEEFTLNFDTMQIEDSDKYDLARRLSNTSDPLKNPHFPTEWNMYWWDNCRWECYKKDITKELVTRMRAGESCCRFIIGKQQYEVDLKYLTQENLTTNFIRRVRCRPTFRSPLSIKSNLRTVILSEAPDSSCQNYPSFSVDPLEIFTSWYPPVWTPTHDQDVNLVEVPFGTEAYHQVHRLFHRTMSETKMEIVSIEQVQNVFQWDKYRRQKQHMHDRRLDQGGTLEMHLFHGTTEDAAKDICWNNFDPRVSGKNGVVYGHGSYFARDASYSNDYARAPSPVGLQHMFLAKVLVGNMSLGKRKYYRPPQLKTSMSKYESYNTCVNHLDNPSIFVVFDSGQCYPYYLIKYRALSEVVDVYK